MDVNVNRGSSQQNVDAENKAPLLQRLPSSPEAATAVLQGLRTPDAVTRNKIQEAMNQTFQSTSALAKQLPTGTVLAFHLLAPIFMNQGMCYYVNQVMTLVLIVFCALSNFLLCFTDSFKDKNGHVAYGFATFNGLWIIDGSATVPPQLADRYRLRFIDFVHAITSVLVFDVIALLDNNTVQCFFPIPSAETQQLLNALPVGVGVLCSFIFVTFPTKRHGIGFPLTN